jgi:hypothetical protein
VRYGTLLARALNLSPPIKESQSRLLSLIPRPLNEALDPAASTAELIDRDGNRVVRLSHSVALDLFGPLGLLLGTLALVTAAVTIAVPRLGLPPLTASVKTSQPGKDTQPQQHQQQQQQQQQQRQQPLSPRGK